MSKGNGSNNRGAAASANASEMAVENGCNGDTINNFKEIVVAFMIFTCLDLLNFQ